MSKRWIVAAMMLWLALPAAGAGQKANVAVFNFQMKSDSPEWVWLEKGLADQITTDFAQSRRITVVERDRMQAVAQSIRWAANLEAMQTGSGQRIQQALKVRYVASGIYAVRDGQVEITGQVVDLEASREVFRKVVSGKAQDVLTLQKRLSAELMGFLTGEKAETVLASLPVWTHSVPAARAIYEGMSLYDTGQYAEAWLKFRQAMRAEPENLEARYWAGKMYCVMNRYDHARPELGTFLQVESAHPRVIDALRDYLYCFDVASPGEETRLAVWRQVMGRFERLRDREGWDAARQAADVVRVEVARQLDLLGRYEEAYRLAGQAPDTRGDTSGEVESMVRYHALTAQTPPAERTPRISVASGKAVCYRYNPGLRQTMVHTLRERILGTDHRNVDVQAAFEGRSIVRTCSLNAANGFVFRGLQLIPDLRGSEEGRMEVSLYTGEDSRFAFDARTVSLAEAKKGVLAWTHLPSTGMLRVHWLIRVNDEAKTPPIFVESVKAHVVQEKLQGHGALWVTCADTPSFVVKVDGQYARRNPGLVGPLSVGPHVVNVLPTDPESPHSPFSTTVTVGPGQVVPVTSRMPVKSDSLWAGWTVALTQQKRVVLPDTLSPPFVLTDSQGIRLLWSSQGDLWTCQSADGNTLSLPQRMGIPLSGWPWLLTPQCLREPSGRYLLIYLSGQYAEARLYVRWSRDFSHWTAPDRLRLAGPEFPHAAFGVCRTRSGRILLAASPGYTAVNHIRLYESSDGQAFTELGPIFLGKREMYQIGRILLLERDDDSVELIVSARSGLVFRAVSRDGQTWGEFPARLSEDGKNGYRISSAVHRNGITTVAAEAMPDTSDRGGTEPGSLTLLVEKPDGTFLRTRPYRGFVKGDVALAHHDRLGWLLAWSLPGYDYYDPQGPYLYRGATLPIPAGTQEVHAFTPAPTRPPTPGPAASRPAPLPAGRAEMIRLDPVRFDANAPLIPVLRTTQAADFKEPPRGSPLAHNARVVTFNALGRPVHVAIDFAATDPLHPGLLRIDFSGKGDFQNALEVPRYNMFMNVGKPAYQFAAPDGTMTIDSRAIPVYCEGFYSPKDSLLQISLGYAVRCRVRMGEKEYDLRISDWATLMRFGGLNKPTFRTKPPEDFPAGDRIQMDRGNGSFKGEFAMFAYGHPVGVDGGLYNLALSPDRQRIEAVPYAGPVGAVRVAHPDWTGTLLSAKGVICIRGNAKAVPVPPGRYTFCELRQHLDKLHYGKRDSISISRVAADGTKRTIDVVAGRTAEFAMGTPITASLEVRKSGEAVGFILNQRDVAGVPLTGMNLVGTRQPDECTIEILDSGGQSVAKFPVRFWSFTGPAPASWRPPASLKGTFTALLRYRDANLDEIKIEKPPTFELP